MPVYAYHCEAGHTFEKTQSITDASLTSCPLTLIKTAVGHRLCGKPVKRLISEGTSFRLKGGGWADSGYS